MRRNRYGMGVDFLIFAGLVFMSCMIVIVTLCFFMAKQKYVDFKRSINEVGYYVSSYDLSETLESNRKFSFSELKDLGYYTDITNPFGGEDFCDVNYSYVIKVNNQYYINAKCGDYYIKNYNFMKDSTIKIYNANNHVVKEIN